MEGRGATLPLAIERRSYAAVSLEEFAGSGEPVNFEMKNIKISERF